MHTRFILIPNLIPQASQFPSSLPSHILLKIRNKASSYDYKRTITQQTELLHTYDNKLENPHYPKHFN